MSSLQGAARLRCGTLATLLFGLALTAASPASAKVVPSPWSGNIAVVSAKSKAGGIEDSKSESPPGPASWGGNLFTSADNDTTGASAFGVTTLATSISDSVFAVASSGFGSAENGGVNRAGALVYVLFVIERTQSYTAYPVVGEGSFGSSHMVAFLANLQSPHLAVVPLLPGETHGGRLAPGIYCLYYENNYRDESVTGNMNSASIQVAFLDVPDPLIDQHPQSQTVAPGANASFTVGASGLAAAKGAASTDAALTYQWRRNYQNLANGGRISGATSSQLQIANVAVSDTGTYDCMVTQSGVVHEPSSLARLTVSGTTGVGDPRAGSAVSLSLPAPSPFTSRTRLRFDLAADADVTLDVLDVGGRRVRTLAHGERRTAGTHAIEWDGLGERGERTPSGVYFVRLHAGAEHRVQRVVRIAP